MDEGSAWKKYGRDTPMFSWKGKCVKARVVDVHDADTCRVVFQSSPGVYSQIILRLDGIDAPEINSHNEQEVAAALYARNRLLNLLAPTVFDKDKDYNKKDVLQLLHDNTVLVSLYLGCSDKYSRTLAQVYPIDGPQKSVNQMLLDERLVCEYHGKTKAPWSEWSVRLASKQNV